MLGEQPENKKSSGQAAGPDFREMAAGVVGGELAAAQINAVLSGIAPLRGLSTRIGTTDEGALRTSVIYELGDQVTAKASYDLSSSGEAGEASAGAAQTGGLQSATNGRTEVSVDWRFGKIWLLRGSFGFGGQGQQTQQQPMSSGLDVLWQYKY